MLVSVIMPTRGRQQMAASALRCALEQTHQPLEILILDDDDGPSFPVPPTDVRYWRASTRLKIGEKRNQLCQSAKGEVIVHFDSDDWSAPTRIAEQVQRLQAGAATTGYDTLLFYDAANSKAFRYIGDPRGAWVAGTSLCYWREWWRIHPFPTWQIGEDNEFFRHALIAHKLSATDGEQMMVARIHADQTSRKQLENKAYRPVSVSEIPAAFFEAIQ